MTSLHWQTGLQTRQSYVRIWVVSPDATQRK